MLRLFFLTIAALLLTLTGFSQTSGKELMPCGTEPHKSEQLIYYQQNLNNYRFLTSDTLYIPIKIHIVGTDEGTGYVSESLVRNAFCTLNESFLQAGIQFYIEGEINYINNTEWYDHSTYSPGRDMIALNNYPGVLNSYVVQTAGGACGYYSRGVDGVVLAINCIGANRQTWAHEIGHQLTLPHTFFGWEGTTYKPQEPTPEQLRLGNNWIQVERWDGENCRHAADGFCDTPPDYLSYRWGCSINNPLGLLITDPLGMQGNVDGTNIMSYASDICMSYFSEEQIQAMRMNLLLERENIINFENEFGRISGEVELLFPQEQQEVQYDEAYLKWRAVHNATEYHVQVSPLPIFSNLVFDDFVSDTILHLPPLFIDRNHFVRIRPVSPISLCEDFSERTAFYATQISGIQFTGENEVNIDFQNLIFQGQAVELNVSASLPLNMNIQLISSSGVVVYEMRKKFIGSGSLTIPTNLLTRGQHYLVVDLENIGRASRKLVIQ